MGAFARHWLDCLDAQIEPATSGCDNLKTFALVDAAGRSASGATPVTPLESGIGGKAASA